MSLLRFLPALTMMVLSTMLLAQQAVVPAGAKASGTGGTLSWTLGQVDAAYLSSASGSMAQGVQQPVELLTVSIPEEVSSWVTLMPNPAHDGVTLNVGERPATDMQYRLLDANGKLLESGPITATNTFIPLADRPAATYLIQLLRTHGDPLVLRVIKQ